MNMKIAFCSIPGATRFKSVADGILGLLLTDLGQCDERYPICYNCERREFDCSFQYSGPPPQKPAGIALRNGTGLSIQDGGSLPTSPLWSPTSFEGAFSRAIELRLMHQWSVKTYETVVTRDRELERAQKELPDMAMRSPFLLDAMFAITALHLASFEENEEERYGDMAITYHDRALAQFRTTLQNPQPEDMDSLFFASALIGIITVALPRVYPIAVTTSATETLIDMSKLFSGTAAIANLAKQTLGEEEWLKHFPDFTPSTSSLEPDVLEVLEKLRGIAVEADEQCNEDLSPSSSPSGLYTNCVERLKTSLENMAGGDAAAALAWPAGIGADFSTRLDDGDPLARLITVCYGLMLYALDQKWWAAGSSQELVEELSPLVLETNPEWSDIINWVRSKIDLPRLTSSCIDVPA